MVRVVVSTAFCNCIELYEYISKVCECSVERNWKYGDWNIFMIDENQCCKFTETNERVPENYTGYIFVKVGLDSFPHLKSLSQQKRNGISFIPYYDLHDLAYFFKERHYNTNCELQIDYGPFLTWNKKLLSGVKVGDLNENFKNLSEDQKTNEHIQLFLQQDYYLQD